MNLTRKEQFAAAALTGLCANPEFAELGFETLCEWSMEAAEELDAACAIEDCTVEEENK